MASLRKRGRVWYYRFVDADGIKRELPGCPDRRATEELARKAETEAAQIKAGVIDPKALGFRTHEARPLAEHLADWGTFSGRAFSRGNLWTVPVGTCAIVGR